MRIALRELFLVRRILLQRHAIESKMALAGIMLLYYRERSRGNGRHALVIGANTNRKKPTVGVSKKATTGEHAYDNTATSVVRTTASG